MSVTLRATSLRKLEGKSWRLFGRSYTIGEFSDGAEANAAPLLDQNGIPVLYLRLFSNTPSPARLHRTSWLIGQQLHKQSNVFFAVAKRWVDTKTDGKPTDINFDFVGVLYNAAQGRTWRAIKEDTCYTNIPLPSFENRVEVAKNLIGTLAAYESMGFGHNDLSDTNLLISGCDCLPIDFDAFTYAKSKTLSHPQLNMGQGGAKGTMGYMPLSLVQAEHPDTVPIGDRTARDMLLIELLIFSEHELPEDPVRYWGDQAQLVDALRQCAPQVGLSYLCRDDIFDLAEEDRISSQDLAVASASQVPSLPKNYRGFNNKPAATPQVLLRKKPSAAAVKPTPHSSKAIQPQTAPSQSTQSTMGSFDRALDAIENALQTIAGLQIVGFVGKCFTFAVLLAVFVVIAIVALVVGAPLIAMYVNSLKLMPGMTLGLSAVLGLLLIFAFTQPSQHHSP